MVTKIGSVIPEHNYHEGGTKMKEPTFSHILPFLSAPNTELVN